MTDKLREAAQQALCALERVYHTTDEDRIAAADALRAALAQQDVEQTERGHDSITITRLAALVDEETQRILADSLSLIEQIKYMVGIAERGTGKKCPDDERPEAFLLAYVKSLEAALAQQAAHAVPHGYKLVPVEPTPEMCNPSGDVGIVAEMAARYRREIWEIMLNAAPDMASQGASQFRAGHDAAQSEIAELEQENRLLRARNGRLQKEIEQKGER